MLVTVNAEYCERSGECITLAPTVFSAVGDEKTVAIADAVSPEVEDAVREAVDFCPRLAIAVTE